ncbi:hypothetical protein ABTD78_21775, partial [Acinetobacter baumannii]
MLFFEIKSDPMMAAPDTHPPLSGVAMFSTRRLLRPLLAIAATGLLAFSGAAVQAAAPLKLD